MAFKWAHAYCSLNILTREAKQKERFEEIVSSWKAWGPYNIFRKDGKAFGHATFEASAYLLKILSTLSNCPGSSFTNLPCADGSVNPSIQAGPT